MHEGRDEYLCALDACDYKLCGRWSVGSYSGLTEADTARVQESSSFSWETLLDMYMCTQYKYQYLNGVRRTLGLVWKFMQEYCLFCFLKTKSHSVNGPGWPLWHELCIWAELFEFWRKIGCWICILWFGDMIHGWMGDTDLHSTKYVRIRRALIMVNCPQTDKFRTR